jgi:hypothetical protein
LQTGNYLNGTALATAGGVSFADFYVSGRAPEFTFWNAGGSHFSARSRLLTRLLLRKLLIFRMLKKNLPAS